MGAFAVPADHPSLPGHFPGEPIVPGVVLLDEALALLLAVRPGMRAAGLASAKFSAPVRPGETVDVACQTDGARVGFTCSVAGAVVARGVFLLATGE